MSNRNSHIFNKFICLLIIYYICIYFLNTWRILYLNDSCVTCAYPANTCVLRRNSTRNIFAFPRTHVHDRFSQIKRREKGSVALFRTPVSIRNVWRENCICDDFCFPNTSASFAYEWFRFFFQKNHDIHMKYNTNNIKD